MNILIKRFSGLFKGVVSGFDRIVFKGMIRPLIYPEGAESFFRRRGVLNKNYKGWVTGQSEKLVGAIEEYALAQSGTRIMPLRSWRERKEELAHRRLRERGVESGFIGAWSCLETGSSFRASFQPGAGRPSLALSAKVSRLFRLLRDHGIIRKNPNRRSYHLTQRGRQIVIAVSAMLFASTEQLMKMAA